VRLLGQGLQVARPVVPVAAVPARRSACALVAVSSGGA